MKRCTLPVFLTVFLLLAAGEALGQSLNVTPLGTSSPNSLVQSLLGIGVSFSNVTYAGTAWSSGTFTGGTGIIGFDSGIILSNGAAASVAGPSTLSSSVCNSLPGDPDLSALAGGAPSYDATVLSFDFVPTYNNITFQYVFASDEYNNFIGSFDDVFGFFINGTNAALIPGTSTVVSINTVNNCTNPSYFIDNSNGSYDSVCTVTRPTAGLNTTMHGLTTVLSVNAAVTPGVTNHIKLAISDIGDCYLDSNVFIRANSFSSGPTATPTDTVSVPTATPTPSFTPTSTMTSTATPTPTDTPCGYPGDTCTPTPTFTPTPTPIVADIFYVSKNMFNSSNPVSIFVFYSPYSSGNYDLSIYNSAGEHIKTMDSRQLSSPVSQWYQWDGTNKYNQPCSSGVYILYLTEPFSRKYKRILLMH